MSRSQMLKNFPGSPAERSQRGQPVVVALTVKRETQGSVLFTEITNNAATFRGDALGNQYVRKHALEHLGNPECIKVTIERLD